MRKVLAGPADRLPRPPYDVEIDAILKALGGVSEQYEVERLRKDASTRTQPLTNALLADKTVRVEDISVPGPRQQNLTVSVVRPAATTTAGGNHPCIFYIHGGALVAADRFAGLDTSVVWAKEFNAISMSVEYGRAPEHTGTQPAEDCYAALLWAGKHLTELGIDPERLLLYGTSAGGGLAAATALMARDKGGPKLCGLVLECPMLDDRNEKVSSHQFSTGPFYNSTLNKFAWRCLLGERAGGNSVSEYEAPARARDLSKLPPTFLDCASAEPFRDEIVAFASKLWEGGVQAELHVWPGGPHGYDRIVPSAPFAILARQTRLAWIRRAFLQAT
ncbi:lipase [Hypoxylon fragiforme]|uniref:lipase n=1 Tax=Hypoxylon fragiforme TaxID=63214 RepID=UPI0020C5C5DC|nr:lipase [Hypoxylon fragiforme]KAI2607152.1 lipase [Hypoxylon fragiforme]